jgi:hypothetical protein
MKGCEARYYDGSVAVPASAKKTEKDCRRL